METPQPEGGAGYVGHGEGRIIAGVVMAVARTETGRAVREMKRVLVMRGDAVTAVVVVVVVVMTMDGRRGERRGELPA